MTDMASTAQTDSLPPGTTAVLVLADGRILPGQGFGAETSSVGEVCFNTSMTGYQEIMTDPSYAGQIITFTFPHIGNVGTNPADIETDRPAALGMIVRNPVTPPANWRAKDRLEDWLEAAGLPGISGIDTRALTRLIRESGAPSAVLCHRRDGQFDLDGLREMAAGWPGLKGMDLARDVSAETAHDWHLGSYDLASTRFAEPEPELRVVAVDFGCKQNILRCLADAGCAVEVVPAQTKASEILAKKPDGVFLSNGPGDPAATADYAGAEIAELVASGLPVFGICIGHQLLALALGAATEKMEIGHRGANHPVKELATGKIEITSQNHGFKVNPDSLPEELEVTHISLFDGSVEGLRHRHKPVFSVQYHPESSPGPHDSRHLFQRFIALMHAARQEAS